MGRHALKDCIIYNWDWYVDFYGQKYPFGVKHFYVYSTTLRPETEMIKEVWIHWVEGFGTFDEDDIYPGVYITSSVSQVNSKRCVIGILNSIKGIITVTNLKVSATQCTDPVSVQKVESSTLDSTENILSQKIRVRELTGDDHMAECHATRMMWGIHYTFDMRGR